MPPCLFPLPLPTVGLCWSWTSVLFGKESPFSALVTFTSQLCYLLRWCVVLEMLTNISLQSTEALNAHRWCYLVTTRPGFHAPQHLGTHSVFSRQRCCVELMFHQRPAQSAIHWLFRRALLEDSVISFPNFNLDVRCRVVVDFLWVQHLEQSPTGQGWQGCTSQLLQRGLRSCGSSSGFGALDETHQAYMTMRVVCKSLPVPFHNEKELVFVNLGGAMARHPLQQLSRLLELL